MSKIDKTDLENITLIKKELKLKNVTSVKIKKEIMKLNFLLKINHFL